MRTLVFTALLAIAAPALAEPKTRTVTVDTPNYEGSRTVTRDREAGTLSRDSEVTRLSDGATRTSEYDRQRGGGHYTAEGSLTRFNGESYDYSAAGRRGPNGGWVRRQGVRNGEGELVAGRRVAVRRGPNGGVVRRSSGFRRR